MDKLRINIIRLTLSLLILMTGNFTYAITHLDCEIDNDLHRLCEMECCSESACFESENYEISVNVSDDKKCCEIHEDKTIEADHSLPPVKQFTEKVKFGNTFTNIKSSISATPNSFCLITYKLKSTNIYLTVSSLRI
jgi:hypothetical protein